MPQDISQITTPSVLIKAKMAYTLWLTMIATFPKIYRYTLGGRVEGYFLDLLELVFISIYLTPEQKVSKLSEAIAKLEGVKFFLQLSLENKCISKIKYLELSQQLCEIGRMLYGWKKGLEKKLPSYKTGENSKFRSTTR